MSFTEFLILWNKIQEYKVKQQMQDKFQIIPLTFRAVFPSDTDIFLSSVSDM